MRANSTMREVARLEAAMAERPPVIHWRLDPVRKVQVPSFIDDPYTDGTRNNGKTACKRNHPFTDDNTIWTQDGSRQCRTCKNQERKPLTPEQKQRAVDLRRQRRRERRALESMQQEADEVAARFEQHRADNTPLMAAARTSI